MGAVRGKAARTGRAGTKRALGRPSQTDVTLDLSGLTGVTLYEPEELVLSAQAGTPLAEIEALVADNNQELAFEPIDCGPLLGGAAGRGTIGGVIAANLSGPRRIKAGAARDHFLGVTAVSGRGETFKSGGRVVKNVTGYDLCKLLAGSWGTLGAMTEVTVKVLPRAETRSDRAGAGARRCPRRAGDGRRDGLGLRCLRRRASARPHRRPGSPACRSRIGHRVAARRRGAVGRTPARDAGGAAEAVRAGRDARREALAGALARRARCQAVRDGRGAREADLAHLGAAGARPRRPRPIAPRPRRCSTTGPAG